MTRSNAEYVEILERRARAARLASEAQRSEQLHADLILARARQRVLESRAYFMASGARKLEIREEFNNQKLRRFL